MIADIVRSAAQLLEAPLTEEDGAFLIDAWVFLNPHDAREQPRRQLVRIFAGESGDLLYLSSTIGNYRDGIDLAALLRAMVGALHCSLHLSGDEGAEKLRIGAALRARGIDPEELADRIREVAVFADRFEAQIYGKHVDVR